MKKCLVLLPLVAACNGLMKSNMDGQDQNNQIQGAGVSNVSSEYTGRVNSNKDTYDLLLKEIYDKDVTKIREILLHDKNVVNRNKSRSCGDEDANSKWPLIEAMCPLTRKPEIVLLFLENGANPNVVDFEYGSSALHLLSRHAYHTYTDDQKKEDEIILKALVKHGANIDLKNKNGDTPLHRSSVLGHINFVKLFVNEFGANTSITNKDGETPLDSAMTTYWCGGKHKEVVDFLEKEQSIRKEKIQIMRKNAAKKHSNLFIGLPQK